MLNKSKTLKILSLTIAALAFVMIAGNLTETFAQSRDPFLKRGGAGKKIHFLESIKQFAFRKSTRSETCQSRSRAGCTAVG